MHAADDNGSTGDGMEELPLEGDGGGGAGGDFDGDAAAAERQTHRTRNMVPRKDGSTIVRAAVPYLAVEWPDFTRRSAALCYNGVLAFMILIFPPTLALVAYYMGMPADSDPMSDPAETVSGNGVTESVPVTQASVLTTAMLPEGDGFDTLHFFAMWFHLGVVMHMEIMDNGIGLLKKREVASEPVQGSGPGFGSCAYGGVKFALAFFVCLATCLAHCEDPDAVAPYTLLFLMFSMLARMLESGSAHLLFGREQTATVINVPQNTMPFWFNPALSNPHGPVHSESNEMDTPLRMNPINCKEWFVVLIGAACLSGASGAMMQFALCKAGSMMGDPEHALGWMAAFLYLPVMARHLKDVADPRTRTARAGIGLTLKSVEMLSVTVMTCMNASPAAVLMVLLQVSKSLPNSFTTVSTRSIGELSRRVRRGHVTTVVGDITV